MADTTDPRLTPLAASLPATVPFVGPETMERQRGTPFAARLGANESAFGPSPRAIAALRDATPEMWQYADPEAHDLRHAMAAHHGIAPAHIMLGEGIDALLGNLVRLLIAPGDAVVTSAGAYPTFNYHVTGFGGTLHMVPYAGDHEDPAALIARAAEVGAKLIYLANPDNPMGSHHPATTIQTMIDAVPDGCLLILDEAYVDLAPDGTAPALDPTSTSVIRMRTFSKAHGLAGLRIGYAIGPAPLIAAFERVRNHFGVNRAAQVAALAALADPDWLPHVRAQVVDSRAALSRIAADNGLTALPSATNFVTIDCGQDGAFARRVLTALLDHGIFARMPGVPPHDRCIRITCGPADAMAAFAAALPRALAAAQD
ncbi:histidinol-phosphate aminotransferase [Loktanella fryxellensis]|uniref:Histidinol-phosphate aminotransferase n=1 Tax=Loktanella fryxellensis TaxID=245187 RepID=A0A1H8GQ32_9RHOB|nr:pyridoxal phosphate-dependent aminotransferase [Loktanella fryxellensis]SEN45607.1 histidinol-phosphate aminotransferase [Loktanella fryxellensis]